MKLARYEDWDSCIAGQISWFAFGFSFYYGVVIPCQVIYLEIFYYWYRELCPYRFDSETGTEETL